MHSREPARTPLNGGAAVEHPEPTLPKPGARGSSPLRDANFRTISDVLKRTEVNSRAAGRRIRGFCKGFEREERIRGYRVVTSSTDRRRTKNESLLRIRALVAKNNCRPSGA